MAQSREARGNFIALILLAWSAVAANYSTPNFTVTAPTPEIARQVGDAAERLRDEIATEWLGKTLPFRWGRPCPIYVKVGQLGAGGQTSFTFEPNEVPGREAEVVGWDMRVQGSLERILDSVLPHEITHTIFACHFRSPLPRWADEGGATLAEHESEKRRQQLTVQQVLGTQRRIPLRKLLTIKEYPPDMQDVLTLYAEGYSLADLLVQKGGRARYLRFIRDAVRGDWDRAIKAHYGYRGVEELEQQWHRWVAAGSPSLSEAPSATLARNSGRSSGRGQNLILRGQGPEERGTRETVALNSPTVGLRSNLSAPAPRKSNPAERRRSPAPTGTSLGMASLGEEAEPERDPVPPAASEGKHSGTATEVAQNSPAEDEGDWTPLEKPGVRSAATSDTEETAAAPRASLRGKELPVQPSPAATSAGRAAGSHSSLLEAETTPDFSNAELPQATSLPRESVPAQELSEFGSSLRGAPRGHQPLARRHPPKWSEFPQISRPSPFVDAPDSSRQ